MRCFGETPSPPNTAQPASVPVAAPHPLDDPEGDLQVEEEPTEAAAEAATEPPPEEETLISRAKWRQLMREGAKARADAVAKSQEASTTARKQLQQALPRGASARAEAAEAIPPTLPRWLSLIHRSHKIWWIGGFVACDKCGASTATALSVGRKGNLPNECTGTVADGSRARLRRLLRGQLPHQEAGWPDARRTSTEVAYPYPLELTDEGGWRLATQGANQ
ncbi:hypothetical protein N9L19_01070 [bacterium]|nr:hypothetical protein [bacterium]